jgi:hypothetical protein
MPNLRLVAATGVFALALAAAINAGNAGARDVASSATWLVRAGKTFQRAGEYIVRTQNTHLADAIQAYGEPTECRVVSSSHVVATWADRHIWISAWTFGGMPAGENGCTSPDLIYVSQIRLSDGRWTTSLGLHVGDPTAKLRSLYPRAKRHALRGGEDWLVTRHGPCIGVCSAVEIRRGVNYPRLTAQVRQGRVTAFWLPVFGQGE